MLVYRVFPYLDDAKDGEPGHPLYEHTPQRGSRIDHPDYYVWYVSRHAEAACGEAFGNQAVWGSSMFEFPLIGARRALATLSLPDSLRVLDLDDPHQLVRLGLRPTDVVRRNLAVTQAWGHRIWAERDPDRQQRWDAVQWWSYFRPSWTVLASWVRPALCEVTPLTMEHPALQDAADSLNRRLTK